MLAAASIDSLGVRRSMEVKVRAACERLRRGRRQAAGNMLCALRHEIDAQDGKHLSPASAGELRTCVHDLSAALNLRPAFPLLGCGGRLR